MPARVVDGDSLWRSEKIKKLPPNLRGEYANLLPLAEANGVFNCDPERVWSDVYSFNRPDFDLSKVKEVLESLESVDLLRRWKVGAKQYGYWTGIEKSGRLPPRSHWSRYKSLPPNPPPEVLSDEFIPDDSGLIQTNPSWSGLDRYGLDRTGGEENNQNNEQENEVKAKKEIPNICQAVFGQSPERAQWAWDQIADLERAHKSSSVVLDFKDWANDNRGDDFPKGILKAYLSVASDRLNRNTNEVVVTLKDPGLEDLEADLIYLSDDRITFQAGHKLVLAEVLREYTPDEIKASFLKFIDGKDLDDARFVNFASKNFVEAVKGLCKSARRRRAEQEDIQTKREASVVAQQAKAAADLAESERKQQEEANAFDPINQT